ncbi:MAG: hypothetical protein PHW52_01640 [Candidatus Pacebacteria bacterium]|nr:hypothetical protein [Candidatus Paceibacterota bacterium]
MIMKIIKIIIVIAIIFYAQDYLINFLTGRGVSRDEPKMIINLFALVVGVVSCWGIIKN